MNPNTNDVFMTKSKLELDKFSYMVIILIQLQSLSFTYIQTYFFILIQLFPVFFKFESFLFIKNSNYLIKFRKSFQKCDIKKYFINDSLKNTSNRLLSSILLECVWF